jgi:hypothetical protein
MPQTEAEKIRAENIRALTEEGVLPTRPPRLAKRDLRRREHGYTIKDGKSSSYRIVIEIERCGWSERREDEPVSFDASLSIRQSGLAAAPSSRPGWSGAQFFDNQLLRLRTNGGYQTAREAWDAIVVMGIKQGWLRNDDTPDVPDPEVLHARQYRLDHPKPKPPKPVRRIPVPSEFSPFQADKPFLAFYYGHDPDGRALGINFAEFVDMNGLQKLRNNLSRPGKRDHRDAILTLVVFKRVPVGAPDVEGEGK